MDKLRERIKHEITIRRLTQLEISREIGCNNSMLNRFVNGCDLPVKHLIRLCDYLQIDPEKEVENGNH